MKLRFVPTNGKVRPLGKVIEGGNIFKRAVRKMTGNVGQARGVVKGGSVGVTATPLVPGKLPNGLDIRVRQPRFLNKNRNNLRLVI